MDIKAILSDLDGTLIDFEGHYKADAPTLIHDLQGQGIQFSLATGKAYFGEVARIIRELNLSPLHIVSGGGMIINWKTGETPWYREISRQSTLYVENYLRNQHLIFSLETKDHAYMMNSFGNSAYTNDIEIQTYTKDTVPSGVLKILVHGNANKLSESQIQSHIKTILDNCKDVESVQFSVQGNFGLDVTSEASTKHTAVLEYVKIMDMMPAQTVAIGDGHNDYPLFTACGYRIAMGNAPRELKEIANLVVDTVENGGMIQALTHIQSLCKKS